MKHFGEPLLPFLLIYFAVMHAVDVRHLLPGLDVLGGHQKVP